MELLFDITIIFAIAVVALLICHRLRVPSIVGFLLAGILAGPDGLAVLRGTEQVEVFSEIGVVLLLFVVGLEFSLSGLVAIRRPFLIGGTLQMFGTAAVVGLGTFVLGSSATQSAYLGFVVSLSSTAIVINLLQERAELESPHGRTVLSMLIFQDIAVVPLMLSAPLLAGGGGESTVVALRGLLLGVLGVAAVGLIAYKWAVPWLLHRIAVTGSRETFLLGVLVICAAIALLTHAVGLSLALGAFLAGLLISESYYSHQAVGVILPFRDVFTSLFFVSVGMLLDIQYLLAHPLMIALLTAGILLVKPLMSAIAALAVGLPLRNAVLTGMALGQIGEFSLVATTAGVTVGLLDGDVFQTVLDIAVLSMLAAPVLIALGPRVADAVARLPWRRRLLKGIASEEDAAIVPYENHLVIVGFGVTGRNVARAAIEAGIDYAVLELNAETVREERAVGLHVHYGDATNEAVLVHVNVARAKSVVVAVNDPGAARRITELARRIAPGAYIVVRSRYIRETEALHALGADEVIADELEISIEVFSRVLSRFLVPREDVEAFVAQVREEWRNMARSLAPASPGVHDLGVVVPDLTTLCFRLSPDSPLMGRTIAESALRSEHSVAILAVRRGDETIGNPPASLTLEAGDVLLVFGPRTWDPLAVI